VNLKCIQIAPGYVLSNKHVFSANVLAMGPQARTWMPPPGSSHTVSFRFGSQVIEAKDLIVGRDAIPAEEEDYVIWRVRTSIPLGKSTIKDLFVDTNVFDPAAISTVERYNPRNGLLEVTKAALRPLSSDLQKNYIIMDDTDSSPGDCGSPIVQTFGSSKRIIGLHWGGAQGTRIGVATPISKSSIDRMLDKFIRTQGGLLKPTDRFVPMTGSLSVENYKSGDPFPEVPLVHTPEFSEIGKACEEYNESYRMLGTLPTKSVNAKFASKLTKTPGYSRVKELAAKYGVELNVGVPKFTTKIVDGKYISPWTIKINQARNVVSRTGRFDEAVKVLTSRMASLDLSSLRIKRLDEVICGNPIDGVSNKSKPINTSTSTGLPFNRQKKDFFFLGDDYFLIDEATKKQYLETLDYLVANPGVVPVPITNGSLKSEVLSEQKILDGKIRVFWIPNQVFILLQRTILGSLVDLFTAKGMHCGIVIGRNLNNRTQLNEYIDLLRKVAPDFAEAFCFLAGDMSSQDDTEAFDLVEAAVSVLYNLAELSHKFSPEELELVRVMCLASIISIRIIKGDVAFVTGGNISGQLITALLNCIVNLILHILAWLDLGLSGIDFYEKVMPYVLGDDSKVAVAAQYRNLYNQIAVQKTFASVGIQYTSCFKEKEFSRPLERLSDIVFLQFQFFRDANLGGEWRAALSLKSLFKALLYYEPSPYISSDALINDTLYNMALAAYYRGQEFYETFRADMTEIYPDFCLRAPLYAVLRARELEHETVFIDETVSLKPFDVEIVIHGDRPDPLTEFEQAPTTNNPVAPTVGKVDTNKNKLDDFLSTFIKIKTFELTTADDMDTDVPGTPFSPIKLYLDNALVKKKFANMFTWRGSFEMKVEYTAVGSSYGLYILRALPNPVLSSDFTVNSNVRAGQLSQGECMWINPSIRNEYRTTLPFVSVNRTAYVTYANDTYGADWIVYCKCLDPIQDVLKASASATVNVWLRPGPDFEFDTLIVQGKVYKRNPPAPQPSTYLSQAASVAGVIGQTLPSLAPMAVPIQYGLSAASKVASALGFTRHLNQTPSTAMVNVPDQKITGIAGELRHVVSASLTDNTDVAMGAEASVANSNEDESTFASLIVRETICNAFSVSYSEVALTVLCCMPVMPGFSPGAATNAVPTLPAYLGAPFEEWRGSMKYTFYASSSNYHAAKFIIFHDQTAYSPGNVLTFDPSYMAESVVWDISTDLIKEVCVHWHRPENALPNLIRCNDVPPLADTSPTLKCNGWLTIAVLSPLTSNTATPTITLFASISGLPNLTFGKPRRYVTNRQNSGTTFWETNLKLHGFVSEQEHDDESCELGRVREVPDMANLYYGDIPLSVRALSSKFGLVTNIQCATFYNSIPSSVIRNVVVRIPFYPLPYTSATNPTTAFRVPTAFALATTTWTMSGTKPFSMQAWYSAMFTGVRGSQLIYAVPKIRGAGNCDSAVAAFPDRGGEYASFSTAGEDWQGYGVGGRTLLNTNFSNAVPVFKVPYSDSRNFYPIYGTFQTQSSLEIKSIEVEFAERPTSSSSTNSKDFLIFQAAGADLTYVRFRHTPTWDMTDL